VKDAEHHVTARGPNAFTMLQTPHCCEAMSSPRARAALLHIWTYAVSAADTSCKVRRRSV